MKLINSLLRKVIKHSLQKNAIMWLHNMRGTPFFKYASLLPHKLQISVQNMQGLHDFIILACLLQKSHIYLRRKLKNVAWHYKRDVIMRCEHHRKDVKQEHT